MPAEAGQGLLSHAAGRGRMRNPGTTGEPAQGRVSHSAVLGDRPANGDSTRLGARCRAGRPSFCLGDETPLRGVKYLLTFRPFRDLPAAVRRKYLAGDLNLLPFPGSLLFWGIESYAASGRADAAGRADSAAAPVRTARMARAGFACRNRAGSRSRAPPVPSGRACTSAICCLFAIPTSGPFAAPAPIASTIASWPPTNIGWPTSLFSTKPQDIGLYHKPMARNVQLWSHEFRPLLDGPTAKAADHPRRRRAASPPAVCSAIASCFPPCASAGTSCTGIGPWSLISIETKSGGHGLRQRSAGLFDRLPIDGQQAQLTTRPMRTLATLAYNVHGHTDNVDLFHGLEETSAATDDHQRLQDARCLGTARAQTVAAHLRPAAPDHRQEGNPGRLAALVAAAGQAAQRRDGPRGLVEQLRVLPGAGDEAGRPTAEASRTKSATAQEERAPVADVPAHRLPLLRGSLLETRSATCPRAISSTRTTPIASRTSRRTRPSRTTIAIWRSWAITCWTTTPGSSPITAWTDAVQIGELPFHWHTDYPFPWMGGWVHNQDGKAYERNLHGQDPGPGPLPGRHHGGPLRHRLHVRLVRKELRRHRGPPGRARGRRQLLGHGGPDARRPGLSRTEPARLARLRRLAHSSDRRRIPGRGTGSLPDVPVAGRRLAGAACRRAAASRTCPASASRASTFWT